MIRWLIRRIWKTKTPEKFEEEYQSEGEYRPEEEFLGTETGTGTEIETERPSEKVLVEEAPSPEEETYGGIFISDRKIQGGFKKFCLSLFSIFILPFILVFGICLATCVFLLVFPMFLSFFPIFLIGLFMLFIIAPVAVPVIIVYLLATERGRLLINSKGSRFSLEFSGGPPKEESPTEHL